LVAQVVSAESGRDLEKGRSIMKRSILVFAAALACASVVRADSYTLGSLDGQNGWSGGAQPNFQNDNPPGDEAVTNSVAHTGTQSWRFSTGYGSPGQGTPFSPKLTASAGLTGSGATADTMSITFWFKPVGAIGDGSEQSIYEGTVAGTDRTGSNLYLTNTPSGVELDTFTGASETEQTLDVFNDTNWHEVTMTTTADDANPADETTTFSIDGGAGITTTPWADLYREANNFPYPAADSVKFEDIADASTPDDGGFYYDDLSYSIYNSSDPSDVLANYSTSFENTASVPLPASAWSGLALLGGLGLIGGLKRRRRQMI
jgi:hypothetical protein